MGESSCVFENFSLASQSSTSQRMAGALSALGESVSFGRFLTESLDWGRWSSFNQKKYIEEAERYSQPGSVAQKKAFFEARYKKASHLRRSVACMEHTALSAFNKFDHESEVDCSCLKDDSVSRGREESTIDSFYSANGDSVNFDLREEEGGEMEVQNGEDAGQVIEDKTNSSTPGKQPLQESSVTNQPRNNFTEKIPRNPKLESTKIPKPLFSTKPSYLYRTKENISSSSRVTCQEGNSVERKRPTPKSLHLSIDQSIGGASTPSKSDIKTKIARFEAASKTSQSSVIYSKAGKLGHSKMVPKFAPQTPQSEPRKTAWERSSFSGRKSATSESDNSSTKNSRVASSKVDRLLGESSVSFSHKCEKKDEKKVMAETELRELRHSSLCFKARPLPDFYQRKGPIKESNEKITPISSQSPVSTRISGSKEKLSQNNTAVPSQKPPLSRSASRKSCTAASTVASFSKDQNNKWTFTFSRR